MKKIMGLVVFVLSLCLITGCGKSSSANTITCTQEQDGEKTTMVATVDGNDKITKIKAEMKVTAESKEELDTSVAFLSIMGSMFNDVDGASFDIKKSGLSATITMNVDISKLSKEQLEELDMEDYQTTGAEFKKMMEDEGATCK